MNVWVVPVVAGPRSQLEPLLCNGIGGMAHYHFSVTPCSTHYAALAHALLTGLLALIVHAILYPGISKVFAVTVKTSQRLCRASERRVEISVVPVCIDPQPCRQVATLGLDFVNFPSLLILSVPQLPDRECVLRESRRLPPSKRHWPLPICVQMVESPLTRRAASSHRIVWSCRRRRSIISE
jgi:hypothetical protein